MLAKVEALLSKADGDRALGSSTQDFDFVVEDTPVSRHCMVGLDAAHVSLVIPRPRVPQTQLVLAYLQATPTILDCPEFSGQKENESVMSDMLLAGDSTQMQAWNPDAGNNRM